jgi:hypothetical protein
MCADGTEAAEESFETILIAFACSRVIFAAQYLTSSSFCQGGDTH